MGAGTERVRLLILDPETARGASWLLFKGRSLGVTHSSNLGSLILRSVVGIHRSLPTGSRVRNKNPTHRSSGLRRGPGAQHSRPACASLPGSD